MSTDPPSAPRRPRVATKPRKRAPGRPVSSRAPSADLRNRILDAAIESFVRDGVAATTLRQIAHAASVTPALLHYYFGDRTQLRNAVIEERLMPIFAELRVPLQQAGDDIQAVVASFVSGIGDLVARNPWLPALWVREVLSEGGALRELLVGRIAPQLPLFLAQRFEAAQRAGKLNPDLDPRLLVVSLVGLTLFPAAGAPIWRRIFDMDDVASLDGDPLRRHTMALLERGMAMP